MNLPVSVRHGFQLNWTSDSHISRDWVTVSGNNFNRPVLFADLPGLSGPKPNLFEWPGDSLNHYTIISRFTLNKEDIHSDGSWGLLSGGFLGCLEVYVNGAPIYSNLPINQLETGLLRQCQIRSTLFEVDRLRIKAGENIVAFHVVGDKNSANLGLYPGNPLLFDKYSKLAVQNTEYSLIALIAVYLAIGLYHLILLIGRPQSRQDLYFGTFCVMLVVYYLTRSNFIFSFIADAQTITRLEYASVFLVLIPFLLLLDLIFYGVWTLFSRIFSGFVFVLAVAVVLPGPLRLADTLLRIWQIVLLACLAYFMLIHGRRPIQKLFQATWQKQEKNAMFVRFFQTILIALTQTPSGNLLLGILTLIVTAIWDILDSIYFLTGIGLTKYGFTIFVIGIAVMLAKHTQKMHSNIESLNAMLENQIKVEIRLKDSFARFVPKPFLHILGKQNIPDVNLGDYTEREMTIMFADIRSFTSISEQLTPKQTFNFINSYLKGAGPIIRKHGGFIDKYMGDGIMALFETPESAVAAAIKLQDRNSRISRTFREEMTTPLKVGIGLHTGHLMLGTIGEPQRMDGTVIADAVNLASRVESLTKQYGAEILATKVTLRNFLASKEPLPLKFRFIDKITVKGKSEPTIIYEILRPKVSEVTQFPNLLLIWENSLQLYYARHFLQASSGFKTILDKKKDDLPAAIYLARCAAFLKEPPDNTWSGIVVASAK